MRFASAAAAAASLCLLLPVGAVAATPTHLSSRAFTGAGLQTASAVTARGDKVWVAGSMTTTVDLGPVTFGSPNDEYIVMFEDGGMWATAFGDPGNCTVAAIGCDFADNLYVAGSFDGTINFGATALVSAGGNDIFLTKYNSSGFPQWSKRFGDASLNDNAFALAIDNAGNVIIGGRIQGTADFGGGPLTTAGGFDVFIAKFNASGTHQWSARFGDASDQELSGLSCDALNDVSGNVYACGKFAGSINLGGGVLSSAGGTDVFMAKLSSAGLHQWSKRFGGTGADTAPDVDAGTGGVALVTNFGTTIDFGGGTLTGAGSQDVAVARFSTTGVHAWSKRYGDQDVQTAFDIEFGSDIFVAGSFEGTMNFGSHVLTQIGVSSDMFFARLALGTGDDVWSDRFGGPNADYATDIAYNLGTTYLVGGFEDDIDFGYGPALFSPTRDTDACMAEFSYYPAEPKIKFVKDLANDQGGKVTVEFDRGGYDANIVPIAVQRYDVYLREDPLPFAAAPPTSPSGETWILAGESPAHTFSSYVTLATTQADSTVSDGMHSSVFKVRAVTDDPSVFFDSPPVAGYSLDNLAPGIPLNLVIEGDILKWARPGDADVAHYSVYGSDGSFDESAVLIGYTTEARIDLATRSFANYFVTATDRAGNEGRAGALRATPRDDRSIPGTLSVSAFPNPFNPATTIRYTLPRDGRVRVDVFDAAGALVRTLVNADQPAGAFTAHWDGRNSAGETAGSGVYFARIQHAGSSRAYKLVMLK